LEDSELKSIHILKNFNHDDTPMILRGDFLMIFFLLW